MTPEQIAKANAELRNKSALDSGPLCEGARASARFKIHCDAALEMSGPLSIRTLKWRECRALLAPGVGHSISRVSLAPGFSRVGCATNDENGFHRFPSAAAAQPLKRLGHRPHLFTGLKPGVNERLHGVSRAVARFVVLQSNRNLGKITGEN